ncbi:MAG TPA: hypothetical protein VGL93_27250 [Streptosporangiaceae bacterium]|jgi:hypothetical protein
MRRRIVAAGAVFATLAATAGAATAIPAGAGTTQTRVVSANPAAWTPNVLDGAVKAITSVGNKIIVGGTFTKVRAASGGAVLSRPHIFAFDQGTGKIDTKFVPKVDGTVYGLAPGPGGTVYAGGAFHNVNGSATRGLTRLYLANGYRNGNFMKTTTGNGTVHSIVAGKDHLYVGGSFTSIKGVKRAGLARVSKYYGVVDTKFNVPISTPRAGELKVQKMALSPKGDRLVIDGTFLKVAGHSRPQVAVIYTTTAHPGLASWSTTRFSPRCSTAVDTYTYGIDFSPGGKYFAITTSGAKYNGTLCDSVSLWNTYGGGSTTPKWVNSTGGDSLYSVVVTGAAVYVGGHNRWLDNPDGRDSAGPGAVSRPGVGAVSSSTGKALSWNPTRTRGHGAEALYATSKGVYIGSDTDELGHEYHARLGFFPLP